MSNHILLTRPRLAERYDRSVATVKRWERDGIVPAPDGYIIDEPYWRPETVAIIDANLNAATTGRSAGYIRGRGNEGEAA
jgi:hypothetical protein